MNIKNFYSTKEKLFLGVLFFAALVSLFFFINFRTLAFPEHNISFDITREQAAEKAKQFALEQGIASNTFKEATVFTIDDASKTYLEREVGVTETARLAQNDIDVWHFTTRFFKPLEQEEISVSYLPSGKFVAYYHEISENASGASLDKEAAQKTAEAFITKTIQTDITKWKLVNSESSEQKSRIDHIFTWEKIGFQANEATYRMEVQIFGDKIGGYYEYLKIPESWQRAYENETSNNDLAQVVAEVLMLLVFGLAIVITYFKEYRHNNLRINSLRYIALAAAVIALLTALNSIPLSLAGYTTTVSWEAFIASIVLVSFLGGLFEGASVLFVITAGEAKFRQVFPQKLSLESLYTTALQTKAVNKALFVGTFAGIIFFTYELLYYFLGKSVGFWAPAAINYSDIYSTLLPWVYPLFIGFLAAASEEGIFRLFGIPFLKKMFKSTWVAIIITAIVWGFLHSNYPQSPWFVRGIEISVIGVVLGWIFVRYGFLASFTAHYTFNALQTAISFYQSGNFYASVSSTLVSLLPFIVAVGLLLLAIQKKGFAPERKEDLNENLKAEKLEKQTHVVAVVDTAYKPLTRKRKMLIFGLSLVSLVSVLPFFPQAPTEELPTTIGREEVKKIADQALIKRQVDTNGYSSVITFTPNDISSEEKYILEVADYKKLQSVYSEKLPLGYWTVTYFKPLQKESYDVDVLPDGKVEQVIYSLDEKAAGANLSQTQAQKLANEYLKMEKGFNMQNYQLIESKQDKKEKRTDHVFVYEEKKSAIGEAVFQTEVVVVGDKVSGFSSNLKLPETWIRQQSETSNFDFFVGGIIGIFGLVIAWFGFKSFFSYLREKKLNFRLSYKIAGLITIVNILITLNSLSNFYSNYNTAIPMQTYIVQSILISILAFVVSFFVVSVVSATFLTLWKEQFGHILPDKAEKRTTYVKDAILASYATPFIVIALSSVLIAVLSTNEWLSSMTTFETFPKLDTYFPALSAIGELPLILGGVFFFMAMLLLIKRYLKTWKKTCVVVALLIILLALPQNKSNEDIIKSLLQQIMLVVGSILLIRYVLRSNLLAYGLTITISILMTSGWLLMVQPDMFFKLNGLVLIVLSLLPAVLYFFPKLLLEFKFGRMVQ